MKLAKLILLALLLPLIFSTACNSNDENDENNDQDNSVYISPNNNNEDAGTSGVQLPYVEVPIFQHEPIDFMIYNGQNISTAEFIFVSKIMGLDYNDLQHQSIVLDTLLEFLTIIDRANYHGFGITDEERAQALSSASAVASSIGVQDLITDEKLVDFYSVGMLLARLLDYHVTSHTPDLSLLQEELEEFERINRTSLIDIQVKHILGHDFNEIEHVRQHLIEEGTAQFDDLAREHSIFLDAGSEIRVISLQELMEVFPLHSADQFALSHMQEGEISHIIDLDSMPLLIYIVSRTEPSPAVIEEAFINNYRSAHRATFVEGLLNTWILESDYYINQSILIALSTNQ